MLRAEKDAGGEKVTMYGEEKARNKKAMMSDEC